jgi:hypothetical protein
MKLKVIMRATACKQAVAHVILLKALSGCPRISCGAGVSPAQCSRDGRTTKLQSYSWTAA